MYLLKGVVSLSTAMITSPGGSLSQNNCSWNTSTDAEAAFSGFPESPYPAEPNVIGGSSKEIMAPLAPPLEDLLALICNSSFATSEVLYLYTCGWLRTR